MKKTIFLSVLATSFFWALLAFGEISHLELGAGNYGTTYGVSEKQFLVLEHTFQDLIKKFGTTGVIYLNDIDQTGLKMAQEWATQWLKDHDYPHITVTSVLGDYADPQTKLPQHVKTAHLTNPDFSQIPNEYRDDQANASEALKLEHLAELSDTGLAITTYYYTMAHGHIWKLQRYLKTSIFIATDKVGYYYYFGSGEDPRVKFHGLETAKPLVFLLVSKKSCEPLLSHLIDDIAIQ